MSPDKFRDIVEAVPYCACIAQSRATSEFHLLDVLGVECFDAIRADLDGNGLDFVGVMAVSLQSGPQCSLKIEIDTTTMEFLSLAFSHRLVSLSRQHPGGIPSGTA
jgi:hypothetical protein